MAQATSRAPTYVLIVEFDDSGTAQCLIEGRGDAEGTVSLVNEHRRPDYVQGPNSWALPTSQPFIATLNAANSTDSQPPRVGPGMMCKGTCFSSDVVTGGPGATVACNVVGGHGDPRLTSLANQRARRGQHFSYSKTVHIFIYSLAGDRQTSNQ